MTALLLTRSPSTSLFSFPFLKRLSVGYPMITSLFKTDDYAHYSHFNSPSSSLSAAEGTLEDELTLALEADMEADVYSGLQAFDQEGGMLDTNTFDEGDGFEMSDSDESQSDAGQSSNRNGQANRNARQIGTASGGEKYKVRRRHHGKRYENDDVMGNMDDEDRRYVFLFLLSLFGVMSTHAFIYAIWLLFSIQATTFIFFFSLSVICIFPVCELLLSLSIYSVLIFASL